MLAPPAVRSNVAFGGGLRQRDHEPLLLIESDLSGDMAVEDQELDAIIRLLAGALMTFSPALEANNRRATSQLAVTAQSVAPHKFLDAQWSFFHDIPHRAAA